MLNIKDKSMKLYFEQSR